MYKDPKDPRLKKARLKWYYKNKEKQIETQVKRRQRLMRLLTRYKRSLSCQDCSFSFSSYPECCDFHHLDPKEKDYGIREAACHSKATMKRELKKCIPLCANCHRTRHKR